MIGYIDTPLANSVINTPNIVCGGWAYSETGIQSIKEHCENPIGTIRNHLKKVKPGGMLYYAIPEKMQTFDKERSVTQWSHLVDDDLTGPSVSRKDHFYEWVTLVEKKKGDITEIDARVSGLMAMNYSIHYHVWDVNIILV